MVDVLLKVKTAICCEVRNGEFYLIKSIQVTLYFNSPESPAIMNPQADDVHTGQ